MPTSGKVLRCGLQVFATKLFGWFQVARVIEVEAGNDPSVQVLLDLRAGRHQHASENVLLRTAMREDALRHLQRNRETQSPSQAFRFIPCRKHNRVCLY